MTKSLHAGKALQHFYTKNNVVLAFQGGKSSQFYSLQHNTIKCVIKSKALLSTSCWAAESFIVKVPSSSTPSGFIWQLHLNERGEYINYPTRAEICSNTNQNTCSGEASSQSASGISICRWSLDTMMTSTQTCVITLLRTDRDGRHLGQEEILWFGVHLLFSSQPELNGWMSLLLCVFGQPTTCNSLMGWLRTFTIDIYIYLYREIYIYIYIYLYRDLYIYMYLYRDIYIYIYIYILMYLYREIYIHCKLSVERKFSILSTLRHTGKTDLKTIPLGKPHC